MNKRALLYTLLAALFLVASIYQARFIQRRLEYLIHPESFVLNHISTVSSGRITHVSNTAEPAGIHRDDVLIAVEGRTYVAQAALDDALSSRRIGAPLTVTISRANIQSSEPESITFAID